MFLDSPEVFEVTMRRRIEGADEEVEQLRSLLADHGLEPETALDVACGIGRHAVELAAADVDVHGIDLSPEYVERARDRASEAGVAGRASFEVADMRRLGERTDRYDLVANMWTAFGYFDEETNERIADGFRERVGEGGALVMELVNKEGMMTDYQESSAQRDDDLLFTERREYTPATGRMETTLTLFREAESEQAYESLGELSWDLRLYSPAELRRLLERAGFTEVSLYGGLDGAALERDSSQFVVVAEP
jgi:ubiquinone/menaquinone biosynthesis C-methylase UbiE